ncbi:MAG: potassium-transporting ATPase subunit KdpA [Bacteroidota bacterium]|nr:potassium-transporting ATPase subunit KdpA [Bacteroidota bacterium]
MFQNIFICLLVFFTSAMLAWLMGSYMNKVYKDRNSFRDFIKPVENVIFKVCGINLNDSMNWKQYLATMAVINAVWLLVAFIILLCQVRLFFNLDHNPSMSRSLALYINADLVSWFGLTLRTEYIMDKDQYLGLKNVIAPTLSANFRIDNLTIIPEFRLDHAGNEVFYKNDNEVTKSTGSFILAATYHF